MPDGETGSLGHPRVHLRRTDSTNERARRLAIAGAPHGTAVTAEEQSAGRGRQGRSWLAPPGSALLCSLVLRWASEDLPPPLLSLTAGVAVCEAIDDYRMAEHTQVGLGQRACLKWPNDVVVEQANGDEPTSLAKLAGILVEGRPQEGWAVLGIGLNVAVRVEQLPAELRGRAASLELEPGAIEPIFERLLKALVMRLAEPFETTLEALRERDALYGRAITWGAHDPQSSGERGRAQGIDDKGQLLVCREDGAMTALSAGEVHLESVG